MAVSDFPKGPGIYLITHRENGSVYVGKSVTLRSRLRWHKRSIGSPEPLKPPTKSKAALRGALQGKSVDEVFEFSILEEVSDRAELASAEKRWITHFHERGFAMYNVLL